MKSNEDKKSRFTGADSKQIYTSSSRRGRRFRGTLRRDDFIPIWVQLLFLIIVIAVFVILF